MRWPVLEMGRNSVRPSTTPRTSALSSSGISISRCTCGTRSGARRISRATRVGAPCTARTGPGSVPQPARWVDERPAAACFSRSSRRSSRRTRARRRDRREAPVCSELCRAAPGCSIRYQAGNQAGELLRPERCPRRRPPRTRATRAARSASSSSARSGRQSVRRAPGELETAWHARRRVRRSR